MSQIEVNAGFFFAHGDHWRTQAGTASTLKGDVDGIVVPTGTLDWPGFGDLRTTYSHTAQFVSDRYLGGNAEMVKLAGIMEDSGRAYIRAEAANAAEAEAIIRRLEEGH